MTTNGRTKGSPEDMNAGTRYTIYGAFAAIALFLIVVITGKPIAYIGSLGGSVVYGIGVCIPAMCVAGLAIYKSWNRKATDSGN
jgi:glutamate dehydrogenase/leucine dehydrogenase